jgi:ankyrin repeat protein
MSPFVFSGWFLVAALPRWGEPQAVGTLPLGITAAEAGDMDKIKKLLAKREDINARDQRGRPVLHLAIWKNHIDAARFLIDQGADVHAQDIAKNDLTRQTPLHLVGRVTATSAELVQALLGKGADVNARDSRGWTPLMWAAASGHVEIVKLLIEHADDVNLRDTHKHNEGHTARMHTYHLEILTLLLQHGADPNLRNDRGLTSYEAALFQAGKPPRAEGFQAGRMVWFGTELGLDAHGL